MRKDSNSCQFLPMFQEFFLLIAFLFGVFLWVWCVFWFLLRTLTDVSEFSHFCIVRFFSDLAILNLWAQLAQVYFASLEILCCMFAVGVCFYVWAHVCVPPVVCMPPVVCVCVRRLFFIFFLACIFGDSTTKEAPAGRTPERFVVFIRIVRATIIHEPVQ